MVRLKRAVKRVLRSPAGWQLAGAVRRNPCLVLAYHRIGRPGDRFYHVDVDVFRQQMQWLQANCRIIGPADLRASSANRNGRPHVLITFDDGYRDYYELAYPILKELNIPAINFLSTKYTDEGGLFWWDKVTIAVQTCTRERVTLPWRPGQVFDPSPASRFALSKACRHHIVDAPDEQRDAILLQFCELIGVDPASLEVPRQVMNWDEVRATADLTEYGGHTHTHVRVNRVDVDTLDREIETCRARIEAELGQSPKTFAYPIGDACEEAKPILRKRGFEVAFSLIEGYADGQSDWYDVRRYPGPRALDDLAWLASGWAAVE